IEKWCQAKVSYQFSDPTWADRIIDGATEGPFGPYAPIPGQKRLMLIEEIVRQDPSDSPSRGWIIARMQGGQHRIWCSPGSEQFYLGDKKLNSIVLEERPAGPIPTNRYDAVQEILADRAFVFNR